MLLNFKEVKRKIYAGRGKSKITREVMSWEFPTSYELVNGQRFWDEDLIDQWIDNYCIIIEENKYDITVREDDQEDRPSEILFKDK